MKPVKQNWTTSMIANLDQQKTHRLLPLLMLALGFWAPSLSAQEVQESFFAIDGDRVQYLDFGGDGPAIVFIHAADRGAETWTGFAELFTDGHRVLAMTARGVPPSAGSLQPTETRVTDLLTFLDQLEIGSAVFIGNSSPAQDMIELASQHSDRVNGLVFLAGAPPVKDVFESDPTGAFALAIAATQPSDPFPYRPRYLDDAETLFEIPALTFVTPGGTRGVEHMPLPMIVGEMVAQRGSDWMQDSAARAFFDRLVTEDELRDQVMTAWKQNVTPAILNNEQAFRDAFGDHLMIAEIGVDVVTGYEYMRAPDLVVPHIRAFLETRVR